MKLRTVVINSASRSDFVLARQVRDVATRLRGRIGVWAAGVTLSALSASANAQATTANFQAITDFLQLFANFMTGPFGKAVVVISIIAAFCTWVFAPKDGIFGPVLRVVVAGIAIMNAAIWVTQFGGASNIAL